MNSSANRRLKKLLQSAVTILAVIGVAVVVRRSLIIAGVLLPTVHPIYGVFDSDFALHPAITFLHIIPGALFMMFAPTQFIDKIREKHLWFHRLAGRILVVCGLIIGITALIMSLQMAIGGANEMAATLLFDILFLYSLGKGFYHIRRGEIAKHREWMIRMFAIGLAIATVRPIVGMFFALTKLSPHEFFGTAFWLGFTIHLIIAEAWINYTRAKELSATPKHAIQ